jgi:hypothetical protein
VISVRWQDDYKVSHNATSDVQLIVAVIILKILSKSA